MRMNGKKRKMKKKGERKKEENEKIKKMEK